MLKKISNLLKIRRQQIFVIDNTNELNKIFLKGDIRLNEITFDNVDHIKDFRSEKHIARFRRFLEEDQYGIYACIESKVVGHAWAKICKKRSCRVNGYMGISQDEALIHYCNVSKSHRRRNIYPAMVATLCQRLFSELKVRRVLIDTEVDNKASLRGIAKVGFKTLRRGTYIQFIGQLIYKNEQLKLCNTIEKEKH